jgi:CHAT domain-containing protein
MLALLWILLVGTVGDRQSVGDTPTALWESYFTIIRSNPGSATLALEKPIAEARERAVRQAEYDEALEYSVLLMLVYNNQAKFGLSYQLYSKMIAEDPRLLSESSFIHKAFRYLGYHSDSRTNRKQDLAFISSIAGTFGNETTRHRLFQALSLDLLGRTLYDHNRYKEASSNLLEANRIIETEGLRGLLGGNYTMLGVVNDALENYRKAIEYYEISNRVFGSLDSPLYQSMAINAYNIGLIYLDRFGEGLRSLPHFEKALEYDRLEGGEESPYLADDFSMLSTAYFNLHDYDRANQYIQRAIEHYHAFSYPENPSLATAYLRLASIASVKKQYDTALASVDKAIGIYELNKARYGYDIRRWLATAHNTRGTIALEMGEIDLAISAFQSTETIALELDRTIYLVDAYRGLIKAYLTMDRPDDAYVIYQKWIKIIDQKYGEARRFAFERRLLLEEINHKRAATGSSLSSLDVLIDDLTFESSMSDFLMRSLGLKTRVIAHDAGGYSLSGTVSHLERFLSVIVQEHNGRTGLVNKAEFNLLMKPAVVEAVDLCHTMYSMHQDRRFLNLAFQFMDVNKSASLMEGLNMYKDQFSSGIPANVRSDEANLEANRNALLVKIHNLTQQNVDEPSILMEAYSKIDSVNSQLDSLQSVIKRRYPTYYSLSQLDTSARLNDVVDALKPDQTLIAYLIGSSQAFALVATKRSQKLHRLSGFPGAAVELKQLRDQLVGRRNLGSGLNLNYLAAQLLPVSIDSVAQLVIIPDGPLNGLPFEILPHGDKMLIEHASISYRSGFRTPYISKARGWDWQGFAPAYTQKPLPHNQTEIERISKIAGGQLFSASNATKERFLLHAPDATVIHLAAHGQINNGNPIFSSILFGDEASQELSAMEIYGLSLKGSLAVLSACATGLNDQGTGDGWMSLSRAFAFAGVQSTLMSLWEVPDRETSMIMESFYRHLRSGLPKDQALQQAKLDYLSQTLDPALKHPYYWAGFVLSGDTSEYAPIIPPWVWATPVMAILMVVLHRQRRLRAHKVPA